MDWGDFVSMLFWSLLIFVHVLAAAFWVGGQLMLVVVVLPLLRRGASPQLVRELASATGRRFASLTNLVLLPILVVTGIALAWLNGVRPDNLTSTPFGRVLLVKVVLVVVVFSLAGLHGVAARRLRRSQVRAMAVATLVISIAIVGLGAALAVLPGA
ncbi:MAG: CopD family protein [Candidatus Dormiibacterota bacterium]